ncbi:hypothetical protein O9H85_37110 [Paenibacillus filicis]|uniref:Transposase n=1 Tax=Paenibacillus gyeongsangnamensis TaxID=3388067 RepID=A0ABT4QLQ4_9BACL|nr:hypothetical protein [Paenibacillus filicis]MCZ8517808.1 hypothetical protein [Paenibacillus filicis]
MVISLNLKRRHLTQSQKAAVVVDMLPLLEKEARERQREHGRTAPGKPKTVEEKIPQVNDRTDQSRKQAAKLVGTNERYRCKED